MTNAGPKAWDEVTVRHWLSVNDVTDAKELFMRFMPIKNISDITGVPVEVLRYLGGRQGEWGKERTEYSNELKEGVKQETLSQLKRIANVGFQLIEAGLKTAHKRYVEFQIAPTLEETEMITRIVKSLHAAKMAEEQSAGGDRTTTLSPQEIMLAFKEDPYLLPALMAQDSAAYKAKEDPKLLDYPEVIDGEASASQDSRDIYGHSVRKSGDTSPGPEQEVDSTRGPT